MSAGARCKETVRHAVINGTCVIILISHRQQTHAYGCHWALRNRCQCQVCVSSLSTGTTGRSEEPKQGSIQDLYSVQCLQFNRFRSRTNR